MNKIIFLLNKTEKNMMKYLQFHCLSSDGKKFTLNIEVSKRYTQSITHIVNFHVPMSYFSDSMTES